MCNDLGVSHSVIPFIQNAANAVVAENSNQHGMIVHETAVWSMADDAWGIACEQCAWLRGKVAWEDFGFAKMAPLVYFIAATLELEVYV